MPRQLNKSALLAEIATLVESAVDEAPTLRTEPYHMFAAKPSSAYSFDIYFVGTETLKNLDRIVEVFWKADDSLCDSIPRQEMQNEVVDLVRQSLGANQPLTASDIDEFFATLRKEPEHEWEVFRPLSGAIISGHRWTPRPRGNTSRAFQKVQRRRLCYWSTRSIAGPVRSRSRSTHDIVGPVRLGPFTVYDPQGHAATLTAAYPNCPPIEIEGQLRHFRSAKAVVSIRIKARDNRRAVERADVHFDRFVHTIRYMIASVGDQYDVGVFDHDSVASLHYFALSNTYPHPLKGMGTHGAYHLIDLGHPYFTAPSWGHDKIWSLIADDYRGNIQGKDALGHRLLSAIQWIGKGVRDHDVGRGRQFVQYMFALEALLSSQNHDVPITDRLAEYTAFILEDEGDARLDVAQEVSRLYGKRSDIAHGRKHVVSNEDADKALQIVKDLVVALLTKSTFGGITDMSELEKWAKRKRYGAHSDKLVSE